MRVLAVAKLQRRWALVLLAGAVAAACGATDAAPQRAAADPVPARCETIPVVALLLDKSRSAPVSLVSQLVVEDLDPLIELLRTCGGDLAVGAIRGRAETPMVRLFIEAPPNPPAPEQVPRIGNPMILAEQRARAERVYQEQLASHEPRSRRWAALTEEAIDEFRGEVRAVIEEPATSPRTDIWAALRQADLFLSESRDSRGASAGRPASIPMRHVLVALTDGIHTAGGDAYRLESRPELFVVNSAGEAGVLAGMNPRRFESFSATLRAIGAARLLRVSGQD